MKIFFTIVMFIIGFSFMTYVMGQVYDGKNETSLAPMDRTAAQHNAMWANVAQAGASQDAVSQEKRYEVMTNSLDNANKRHFNTVVKYKTIKELTDGEVK